VAPNWGADNEGSGSVSEILCKYYLFIHTLKNFQTFFKYLFLGIKVSLLIDGIGYAAKLKLRAIRNDFCG